MSFKIQAVFLQKYCHSLKPCSVSCINKIHWEKASENQSSICNIASKLWKTLVLKLRKYFKKLAKKKEKNTKKITPRYIILKLLKTKDKHLQIRSVLVCSGCCKKYHKVTSIIYVRLSFRGYKTRRSRCQGLFCFLFSFECYAGYICIVLLSKLPVVSDSLAFLGFGSSSWYPPLSSHGILPWRSCVQFSFLVRTLVILA